MRTERGKFWGPETGGARTGRLRRLDGAFKASSLGYYVPRMYPWSLIDWRKHGGLGELISDFGRK